MTSYGVRFALALCVMIGACHAAPPIEAPVPPARTDWQVSLGESAQEATAGRYASADKILTDFASKYPSSNEATESMFWRALYKVDPANPSPANRDAMMLLDGYVQSPQALHRNEAAVLRRVANAMEAHNAPVAGTPAAGLAPRPDDKARDEELQHIKEELAKTTAELDRIKRRLAAPKP